MIRFTAKLINKFADETLDRVIRNIHQRIDEIAGVRLVRGRLIQGVKLADGVETPVAHDLGHRAILFIGVPRQGNFSASNGRLMDLTDIRADKINSYTHSMLKATGFGGTLTVDIWAV